MADENLNIEEVAIILKLSKATVWKMCKQHTLPAFKMPGRRKWLINRKDLEKLQSELKKQSI